MKVQNKLTEVEEKLKLVESRTVHQDKAQDEISPLKAELIRVVSGSSKPRTSVKTSGPSPSLSPAKDYREKPEGSFYLHWRTSGCY